MAIPAPMMAPTAIPIPSILTDLVSVTCLYGRPRERRGGFSEPSGVSAVVIVEPGGLGVVRYLLGVVGLQYLCEV